MRILIVTSQFPIAGEPHRGRPVYQTVRELSRLADVKVLSRYERRRMPHNLALMAAMEGFERLFQADPLPVRWLRNSGLKMVDQMPEAKALFVRQALGLTGDLPELAKA